MFFDRTRVGSFAVKKSAVRAGHGDSLFRVLVATTMFQRRQDVQVLRILRGMLRSDVRELTTPRRLLALVDASKCRHLRSTEALHDKCDLAKHAVTRAGCCEANADYQCHLKRHTVLLKRYGHFGKVPTSVALVLREAGVRDLTALRRGILRETRDPGIRARLLEAALSRAWRINQKIASMYLSAVSNPDLSVGAAPWAAGIDWTYFVVVDSNVDLFLKSIGYRGSHAYDARREFVRALAARIDLRVLRRRLHAFNPRLVQQAMYLFMSATNRRASPIDCMYAPRSACPKCPAVLRERCPVRRMPGSRRRALRRRD